MNIRIGALVIGLALSLPVAAELTTQIRAVEATTSNLNVPTSGNGRLTFKPCAGTCDAVFESARLTPLTSFRVNGQATDFAGFRKAFYNLSRSKDHYALVSYDTAENTVTSVQIAD